MNIKIQEIIFLLRKYNIKKYSDEELVKFSLDYFSKLLNLNKYEMEEGQTLESLIYQDQIVNDFVNISFDDSISLFNKHLDNMNLTGFEFDRVIDDFFVSIENYQNVFYDLALVSKMEKEDESEKEDSVMNNNFLPEEKLNNYNVGYYLKTFKYFDLDELELAVNNLNNMTKDEKNQHFQMIIDSFEESVKENCQYLNSFKQSLLFYLENIQEEDNDYFINWLVNIEGNGNDSFTEKIITNFPLEGSSKLIHYYKSKMEEGISS